LTNQLYGSEIRISLNNISREYNAEVTKLDDLITLIEKIGNMILCNGSGIRNRFSRHCSGENKRKKTDRCDFCAKLRKQLLKQNKNLN
jgi:hypothetical protein